MDRPQARLPRGYRLLHLDEVDSTNAEALRRAADGERGPQWVWADSQLKGRGRQGRHWESRSGNLYASLLLALPVRASASAGLSLGAPVAVRATLKALLPSNLPVDLKWPNDVLLPDGKVAGILLESIAGEASTVVVIGCGINVRDAPLGTRYGATALARHGIEVTALQVLEELARQMDDMLRLWNNGKDFETIRRLWLDAAKGIGSRISIKAGGETVEGIFEGLSADGALLLRLDSGALEVVRAGDVSMAFGGDIQAP
ncbi:MAG TPA: biotin--[acetyl-CoA-carboxylase] ligase [Aestuariivirgaceae bacterium]|nr:biotin--[acetyl-CoA-carboxylase] ligase [Aestuariivirgaceae bacterium]